MGYEIFKPIVATKNGKVYDFTGYYEVSNYGHIRSIAGISINSSGRKYYRKPCDRTPWKDKDGYLIVSLYKDGKGGLFKVHRLVAEAFLPNPTSLPLINHKDENKANNFVDLENHDNSNIEWCTHKYNTNYGTAKARRTDSMHWCEETKQKMLASRIAHGSIGAPKAVEQIDPITNEVIAEYYSLSEAMRQIGVRHIREAIIGERITSGGYKWRYKN